MQFITEDYTYTESALSFLSYSDTHVRMLEDCIQETILEQNKLAAGSDRWVSDSVSLAQMWDFTVNVKRSWLKDSYVK